MNRFEITGYPLLFVAALELALGLILLSQAPRNSSVNKSVATFSFFTSAFALCTALMYIRASLGLDFNYFARANWIGWFSLPAALQFIFYLRDERSRAARVVAFVLYPLWFVIFCLSLFTELLVRKGYSLIPYINRSGPLDVPARIFGSFLILWAFYEIYRLRREVTGIKRKQLNYFFTGIFIFACGGMLTAGFPQAFGGFGLEPGLGSYFGLPWVILTFYAISRYSLFDLPMIFSRGLSVVLLSLMIAPIQILLLKLLEPAVGSVLAMVTSLPLITYLFFGTPFSRNVHAWVSNIIIKGKYDYQQILRDSTRAVVTILGLNELLDHIMNTVRRGLLVENACLYLRGEDGRYTVRHGFGIYRDMVHKRSLADVAVQWIEQAKQTVIREQMEMIIPEGAAEGLDTYMRGIGAELFVPLFYKDRLQGALALGPKGSGDPYVRSDIALLEVLAGQAAVAIENARLYEDARRARESLQESEGKFSMLARTIPAAIFIHRGRKFLYANPAGESMSGYGSEELLNMDFRDLVHRDYRESIQEGGLDRLLGVLAPQQNEFKIVKKNGEERWVIMAAGTIDYDGKAAILGTLIDITDVKKLEGQLRYAQKMEAIGRLSAGIAHDFNNILSVIVGYGSTIQAKLAADDPLRPSMDQILASAERATSLTRSLLAFGAKEEIKLVRHELNGLIKKMGKFLSGLIRRDIDLQIRTADGLLPVLADDSRLERVVMNLVVNAGDAMPEGGTITIETGRMHMDVEFIKSRGFGQFGAYAFFSVADTGIGMDESVRKRIFEPFFTTKASGKGTGFGLSIVYDILKEHSGYVDVVSGRGKGTTFTVYLPVLEKEMPAAKAEPAASPLYGRETILLAEDDEAARTYCAAVFGEYGYQVIEARDGEEAIKKFRENWKIIKLLILDVIMPKMNGREVYEAARKVRPDAKTLFISGYAEDLLQKTGILEKNHPFLMKPTSQKQFLKKVREVLDS